MPLLETLRAEYEAIGPKVAAADAKIEAALAGKEQAVATYEKAKTKVRKLLEVRDPLRIEQMQLEHAIGDVDGSPPGQTITNGGGS